MIQLGRTGNCYPDPPREPKVAFTTLAESCGP